MPDVAPASLDTAALSHRLAELAGHERQTQVEFLLHLDVFDQRRAWAEAGYPSLWEWCVRALHLSEGAAGRRIAAMRVLRRFPGLAEPLRDGRLSLSTVAALGPVLTEGNWEELVERAAFKTKVEAEHLVASLQPRQAPREGLRRLPRPVQATAALSKPLDAGGLDLERGGGLQPAATSVDPLKLEAPAAQACPPQCDPPRPPAPRRATLEPVDGDSYSLRVTVDAALKKDLDGTTSVRAERSGREAGAKSKHATTRPSLPRPFDSAVLCAQPALSEVDGLRANGSFRFGVVRGTASRISWLHGSGAGADSRRRPVPAALDGSRAPCGALDCRDAGARPHQAGGARRAQHRRQFATLLSVA